MPTLDEMQDKLSLFLKNNPVSKIEDLPTLGLSIVRPWGDSSLVLQINHAREEFFEALNNLFLPDQYSAIYHIDKGQFEVIFTAFKLGGAFTDLEERSFDFIFEGTTYRCEYDTASPRLMEIALQHVTLSQSPTQSRNLSSFRDAADIENVPEFMRSLYGKPMSFWIKNLAWSDSDYIKALFRNLNFYMAYFDTSTPRILIHSLTGGSAIHPANTRYPFGTFPTEIVGHRIDDNLYQFWDATLSGDSIRRFLYNFQILEYASVYYLDEENKRAIRKLLITPDASSKIDVITQSIIETLSSAKMHESQKMEALIRKCVDAQIVWNEIQKNLAVFSEDMRFEGGFVSKRLLTKDTKFTEFEPNWVANVCGRIRDIRNALSHGKETKSGSVIFPTIEHRNSLQYWLSVISTAARQVTLYRDVV